MSHFVGVVLIFEVQTRRFLFFAGLSADLICGILKQLICFPDLFYHSRGISSLGVWWILDVSVICLVHDDVVVGFVDVLPDLP